MYQANRRNNQHICPKSCSNTNVYLSSTITGEHHEKDIGILVVYFRRDIKVISEYLLYSLMSMIAEIAAYTSLLLGNTKYGFKYEHI